MDKDRYSFAKLRNHNQNLKSAEGTKTMNKTIQQRINEAYSYMRLGNRGHQNCIRLNPSCSRAHNQKIIDLCLDYLQDGIPFVTEAAFKSPFGRCDIMLPATFDIIEVAKSETDKRFAEKKYPDIFKVNMVRI